MTARKASGPCSAAIVLASTSGSVNSASGVRRQAAASPRKNATVSRMPASASIGRRLLRPMAAPPSDSRRVGSIGVRGSATYSHIDGGETGSERSATSCSQWSRLGRDLIAAMIEPCCAMAACTSSTVAPACSAISVSRSFSTLAPRCFVIAGRDRQVAFGVGSHRPVAEIGGADPHIAVVDDHHLRMDVRIGALAVMHDARRRQQDAIGHPRLAEDARDARPAGGHHRALQLAAVFERTDDHGLELRIAAHRLGQGAGEARAGQVLALDIDRAARARDQVVEQGLDFLHDGMRGVRRLGARDRDLDIAEMRLGAVRPWGGQARHLRQFLDRRARPALARQVRHGFRGIAVHHDLHVVEPVVRLAGGIDAMACRTGRARRCPSAGW